MRRAVLGRVVLAVVVLSLVAPAGAEPGGRSMVSTPSAVLMGVSCTSPAACIAVGSRVGAYGLVDKWDGQRWSIMRAPHPRGAPHSYLFGVSCPSSRACMAVGDYDVVHGSRPLAEIWNGKAWRVVSVPSPSSASGLDGVSCGSARSCIAVGHAIRASANNAFSETWNGRRWSIARTPLPQGTTWSDLGSVSCASATACVAVGSYQVNGSAKSRTLAETWNGKTWARSSTPSPASGANGSQLLGVSCSSTSRCVAVGNYANDSNDGSHVFAEMWDGHTWVLSSDADVAPGTTLLSAVSCPLANACIAVGGGTTSTLAEAWSGGRWTTLATPSPKGAQASSLEGVSCPSMNACVAVGDDFPNAGPGGFPLPLAEVWNGTAWTVVPTPF